MSKIYFINGREVEISLRQFDNLAKALRHAGVKVWLNRETGDLLPLNSTSMAMLERGEDDGSYEKAEASGTDTVDAPEEEEVSDSEQEKKEDKEEKRKETQQEKADKIMAEMKAKSDCAGNGHKGKNQIIYYQNIQTKNGHSKRFFPVCEFCGGRGRYIKAANLSEGIQEAAKVWVDKG